MELSDDDSGLNYLSVRVGILHMKACLLLLEPSQQERVRMVEEGAFVPPDPKELNISMTQCSSLCTGDTNVRRTHTRIVHTGKNDRTSLKNQT